MTTFKITDELIEKIQQLIEQKQNKELTTLLSDLHYADIAEIIHELDTEEGVYIIRLIDAQKTSDVLTELDDDYRENILKNLSAKEIADEIIELDTDDAVDIISELPEDRKTEVISHITDVEHAKDIVELLRYDEDTAGGLMAKELVKVNENWNVLKCVKEMREQAAHVTRVHSIYVVDDNDVLKGRLSLKDLLTTSTRSEVKDIYIPKVDYVYVTDTAEEVAHIMSKYDLEAIPVVDEMKRLVGRITIDDVVDVIREEAEKDYQLAAGITNEGLANNSIDGELIKRLLKEFLLGLINGGTIAGIVILVSHFAFKAEYLVSITVAIALITVIVNAAVIGTFIPILLHKRGIDPAVATGPFITTSNDVLGILIYFFIAKMILGF